jgi:hypothetical protein
MNPEFKGNTFVSSYGRVYKSDFDNCFKDHGNFFLQSLRSTSGVCYSGQCQPRDNSINCPWGYNGISQNLDGSGKAFAQPHSDSSRTIQDCANLCSSRQGCTSFEFAIGNTETGACITYTGGDSNVRNDENRLSQDANWRSCVKETLRPTDSPSPSPTSGPTTSPTSNPSQFPSSSPVTSDPTASPTTTRPTQIPSSSPVTSEPTAKPSIHPSLSPSNVPTPSPTTSPTSTPSQTPSSSPVTSEPTVDPTTSPTSGPTTSPTSAPSEAPTTNQPSKTPSMSPTHKGFEGSLCSADDECDSLRCNVGEFPYRCRKKKSHSEECQKHSDCKSDKCLDGKCVDGRENDTCNSNDDCDSGRCAFGVPLGKCQHQVEHGSSCIRDNDCASGHCLLFACTDHRDGAHCVNDDDCVQGSSCAWSVNGGKCKKNNGCTFWNWMECSEQCTWFQKMTNTCY